MKLFPQHQGLQPHEKPAEQPPRPFFLALVLTGVLALEMHPTLTRDAAADAKAPQLNPEKQESHFVNRLMHNPLIALGVNPESVNAAQASQEMPQNQSPLLHKEQKFQTSQTSEATAATGSNKTVVVGEKTVQQPTPSPPNSVQEAVRQDLSHKMNLSPRQLRIVEAAAKTWPNTCLGLAQPEEICGEMLVEGWRIVLSDGRQTWVYRTDAKGRVLRMEPQSRSQGDRVQPSKIPMNELPPALTRGMIFRVITSGGITGRTYETILMEDGQLIRVLMGMENADDRGRQVFRVPRHQVQQFQRLLNQQKFSQFHQLSYPAPTGSADFITVTLTSATATTRYADMVLDRLPLPLQNVVKAWNQITKVTAQQN